GEVNGRRHVSQLDEIDQILERAVAPPALDVAHERRAADRGEHRSISAEAHVALGVAREQREFRRCGGKQPARQPAWYVHALALHVRTRFAPQTQRLGVAPELDADLREYGLGIGLD